MKNSFYTYLLFILIFIGAISLQSCYDPPPKISRQNKITADSIFRIEENLLKEEVDSICALSYKEKFDLAVDSISAVRIREIENISN